jgi:uncharacterized protein|uniref:CAAX prenyl protease 2/Lysostaphin resistance protein A-like domain-containing protein n=1 Tax=Ostreococcus mediterraneus TaxID=1486918 RepID=A0A7S0PKM3_9CHLO|mmetsp:Transcript_4245/g.15547  ORF Transcript_4245/g.15547 Transcript_4245/m.15547 type:complete len:372 (+) Transcript_4245:67-1182(+)
MRPIVSHNHTISAAVASTTGRTRRGQLGVIQAFPQRVSRVQNGRDAITIGATSPVATVARVQRARTLIQMRTSNVASGVDGLEPSDEDVDDTTVASKFLKLPRDGKNIWMVPWGLKVTIQIMVLWLVGFCLIGNAVFPYCAGVIGFDTHSFTQRGLATYSLCLDFTNMLMTGFVLRQSLRPYQPLPENWFPMKWFEDKKWLRDVALACVAFPFVVWLHGLSTNLLEHVGLLVFDDSVSSAWEQSMKSNDFIAKGFYMLLASFATPIWEEFIFRGFFFPSLTAITGMKRSMLISSAVFALAHFSLEQFIPLTFLGVLMCVVYVRTRNLLAPILVHSCWNAFVLASELLPQSQAFNVFVSNVLYELQRIILRV